MLAAMAVFDLFHKKKRTPAEEENRAFPGAIGGVGKESVYEAAHRTELPLNHYMTRLMAQELPILDSSSRRAVYELLRQHSAAGLPEITCVEELPEDIRVIMDLR